jgi:hypothetical protein
MVSRTRRGITPFCRGGHNRKEREMTKYDPAQIAILAATQLQGYDHHRPVEPHHVRAAVATARMIVDEVAAELAETPNAATA